MNDSAQHSTRRTRPTKSTSPPQFQIKDLLIFTAAVAVLCAALRYLDISPRVLLGLSLIFGGVAAAMILLLEVIRRR